MAVIRFMRSQPVLCIAAVAAILSMIAVPPSEGYLSYIDVRVLGLLFCLMLSVAGLQQAGLFAWIAGRFLNGQRPLWFVSLVLTLLCFFTSMLVTNDVALITFVPFTLYVMQLAGRQKDIARIVVLQTLAANLGSMVTPFGNPQNLFLFAHYEVGIIPFVQAVFPFAALSLALLIVCHVRGGSNAVSAHISPNEGKMNAPCALVFGLLFALSVLCVVQIIPLVVAFVATVAVTAAYSAKTLKKVDYALLGTFVCFFVFSGNLAQIDAVRQLLGAVMDAAPFFASLLASQVISNVPAAVLLAPFTADWTQLLLGVDIGGLGTPVASLASLISLEFYRRARVGSAAQFLGKFTLANIAFLAANCLLWAILYVVI